MKTYDLLGTEIVTVEDDAVVVTSLLAEADAIVRESLIVEADSAGVPEDCNVGDDSAALERRS